MTASTEIARNPSSPGRYRSVVGRVSVVGVVTGRAVFEAAEASILFSHPALRGTAEESAADVSGRARQIFAIGDDRNVCPACAPVGSPPSTNTAPFTMVV